MKIQYKNYNQNNNNNNESTLKKRKCTMQYDLRSIYTLRLQSKPYDVRSFTGLRDWRYKLHSGKSEKTAKDPRSNQSQGQTGTRTTDSLELLYWAQRRRKARESARNK